MKARVVSVGNLTVGGTGKTTLVLHLARLALARGENVAVVCRRYRPGPGGEGDEERLFAAALGSRVYAGTVKRHLAERAASEGRTLVLLDDGFSHWSLERDLDLVLLDARNLWGGDGLLPRGRLREPRRALQRADVVVVSRLDPGQDPAPLLAEVGRYAPGAATAAGRHRVTRVRGLGGAVRTAEGPALVVTATGNPLAVERTVREAGFETTQLSAYRDHHWFSVSEARAELDRARHAGATLVLTSKDEARWPPAAADERVAVVEVEWEWVCGGARVERMAFEGGAE